MKALRRIIALILIVSSILPVLSGCKGSMLSDFTEDTSTEKKDYYYVAMAIKNMGVIIVELDAVNAPITTKNFVKLVREDFYDGLTFHRVIENFMIQGGDPKGDGTGNSPNKIMGEFIENGVYNPIKHERGVISMARGTNTDSASCQFFICNSTSASVKNLDGKYAAFGHVVEGLDIVDKITAKTASFGDANGTIKNKKKQVVIVEMMVIEYEKTN